MDSQENAMLQGAQEEQNVEQTAVEQTAAADVQQVENTKVYKTKQEVVDRLKEIVASDEAPVKEEIDLLKTVFYKLHIAEREARLKEYINGGGNPEAYQVLPDETEETFKAQMAVIREKRAQIMQQQEAEKQANLEKKLEIIEKIKAMATSPDEAGKSFGEFKELQQQWKDIKNVPADKANELWRNYQLYVEQFYDLLKLNSEARFKAASTVINKRHQQHFEDLRAKEEENLARKTALCEKVEELCKTDNKGAADWEKHSKEIIDIQNEWKTIGFAPQKMNVKIFERFRAACDDFFGRKAEYFKALKATFSENIEKKKALVEKAQALADSTDWKATSDKLIALQKEWKTIGMVPKKLGDQLWQDFLGACNKFFEARNAAGAGQRNEEHANLEKKQGIIEQLKALAENAAEATREKVQALTEEYNKVGHVPYKEKDKLYEAYHEVLDRIYKELNISTKRRRLNDFKANIKNVAKRGEEALDNSKKGNSLIDEMNRKVQHLRDDLELVRQKIKAIDAENK